MGPRLGFGLLSLIFLPFQARQLDAVTEQHLDQAALRINGSALLYHQHGQQAVGNQKQNDEHGKERASGLGHPFIARQVPQNGTPIYAPGRAGMNTECSWSANNDDFGKSLQTKGLVGIV